MQQLAELFTEAGGRQVRTYIQSGNVVFSASPASVKTLPDKVTRKIADRLGFRAIVLLRTAEQFQKIASSNPFLASGADPRHLHVAFLVDRPAARAVNSLDQNRSPGDSFSVLGHEIFLLLPNGVSKSRLTNDYFDTALGTTSTLRNWRTVLALRDLTPSQTEKTRKMTPAGFRRIALNLPGTREGAHMDHPDFRVQGKIFATLFSRDESDWGMVKLKPNQQREFVKANAGIFEPSPGAWGRQGCTQFLLSRLDRKMLKEALFTAWRNAAPPELIEDLDA